MRSSPFFKLNKEKQFKTPKGRLTGTKQTKEFPDVCIRDLREH